MNGWLLEHLACPRDHSRLVLERGALRCALAHEYPCVDGVPILLVEGAPPTHPAIPRSLAAVRERGAGGAGAEPAVGTAGIDPFVQREIVATNGLLYRGLVERLPRYPIPELRLPPGDGSYLLDVGCNWGRWSIAAARRAYTVIGIDPSLDAILAARRVAAQLAVDSVYVVGDARFLPFRDSSFDTVFAYSVIQHFDRTGAAQTIREIGRVLKPGGVSLIQLANALGLRNLMNQARRGFRAPTAFNVRYWLPGAMLRTCNQGVGPSSIAVDGFFCLNPQLSDLDLLPPHYRLLLILSERLRRLSMRLPWMTHLADSIYVTSTKDGVRRPAEIGSGP